ncbi:MAG: hypothetical protein M3Y59_06110 [Myxococcota bacterium]|nr:hypothetical protein [Myxococcota bacterium]
MNKLLTAAFLALVLGQGCVINNHPNPNLDPGNVTFFWTFFGETCGQSPEVASVRVTIPNEALDNNGVYGCLNGGFAGITLHDFVGGNYSYTLEGLGNTGQVLYRASGTFAIDGDVRLDVDLTPVGQQTSFAYFSWSFPSNWASATPSCADATVTSVYVEIDDSGIWDAYDCTTGTVGGGATSRLLAPGEHKIDLEAYFGTGPSEYLVASRTGTFITQAHAPSNHSFTFQWDIGGTTVAWQLKNGGTNQTCAAADVGTVYLHFYNVDTGKYVDFGYGEFEGDPADCTAATVTYRYLEAGTYDVWVSATNGGGVDYLTPDQAPARLTVTAGAWTPDSPPVVTIEAFRQ